MVLCGFAHDPRVTRVGPLARATASARCRHLWNIFRVDRMLGGPACAAPGEIDVGCRAGWCLEDVPAIEERCRGFVQA